MYPAKCLLSVSLFVAATLVGMPFASAANIEGQLDPYFNGSGKQVVPFFSSGQFISAVGTATAVQADGKIVIAGAAGNGAIGLARLNADGSIDAGFGDHSIGEYGEHVYSDLYASSSLVAAASVAVQPDGKILVGGYLVDSGVYYFFVARFLADGSNLDYRFGGYDQGAGLFDFGQGFAVATAMALAPDGSIYLAGYALNGAGHDDFAVVKLQPDGTLDTSYGIGGMRTFAFDVGGDLDDVATAATLQSDGKLVVAGQVDDATDSSEFGVLRVDTSGNADSSFGTGGKTVQSFHNAGTACNDSPAAVKSIPPTLVRGRVIFVAGTDCAGVRTSTGVVAAFNDDGTLYSGFNGGYTNVDLDSADYEYRQVTALVLQPPPGSNVSAITAPKLIVIGTGASIQYNDNADMVMTRLDPNGLLDSSFGDGGSQFVYFNQIGGGEGDDGASSAVMVGNGYLIVGGYSQVGTNPVSYEFAAARLLVGDGIFHGGFELPF